ncbi:MAG: hypothetical protein ABI832_04875 [bacterium]
MILSGAMASEHRAGILHWNDHVAHTNKVIRSINRDGETICVDIFVRPDGTYGFEEYRRDPEDGRGWFAIGRYATKAFSSPDEALAAARKAVSWLNDRILE